MNHLDSKTSQYAPDANAQSRELSRGAIGLTIPRTIGITAGIVALAASSDPLVALVICLTLWFAGLLMRWPARVLSRHLRYPLSQIRSFYDVHLWTVGALLLMMLLFQHEIIRSAPFWLLMAILWYHLFRLFDRSWLRRSPG